MNWLNFFYILNIFFFHFLKTEVAPTEKEKAEWNLFFLRFLCFDFGLRFGGLLWIYGDLGFALIFCGIGGLFFQKQSFKTIILILHCSFVFVWSWVLSFSTECVHFDISTSFEKSDLNRKIKKKLQTTQKKPYQKEWQNKWKGMPKFKLSQSTSAHDNRQVTK